MHPNPLGPDSDLRARSGNITSDNRLVAFLHDLMRGHVAPGTIESLVGQSVKRDGSSRFDYDNGFLASYALDVAARLTAEAPKQEKADTRVDILPLLHEAHRKAQDSFDTYSKALKETTNLDDACAREDAALLELIDHGALPEGMSRLAMLRQVLVTLKETHEEACFWEITPAKTCSDDAKSGGPTLFTLWDIRPCRPNARIMSGPVSWLQIALKGVKLGVDNPFSSVYREQQLATLRGKARDEVVAATADKEVLSNSEPQDETPMPLSGIERLQTMIADLNVKPQAGCSYHVSYAVPSFSIAQREPQIKNRPIYYSLWQEHPFNSEMALHLLTGSFSRLQIAIKGIMAGVPYTRRYLSQQLSMMKGE